MFYDATPNANYSVHRYEIGRERQPVLIVDDYLADPDSMVRYACDEVRFAPPSSAYPGLIAPAPPPYVESLGYGLSDMISETFGVLIETADVLESFFGLVTTPPERLEPIQRLPHVDSHDAGQLAMLHYLCSRTHGGTAFYRHRPTGYESLDQTRSDAFAHQWLHAVSVASEKNSEYLTQSDALFEQTASFESRYNRLVLYRSHLFHSGRILPECTLSDNPRSGRLTVNTFVRFAMAR